MILSPDWETNALISNTKQKYSSQNFANIVKIIQIQRKWWEKDVRDAITRTENYYSCIHFFCVPLTLKTICVLHYDKLFIIFQLYVILKQLLFKHKHKCYTYYLRKLKIYYGKCIYKIEMEYIFYIIL